MPNDPGAEPSRKLVRSRASAEKPLNLAALALLWVSAVGVALALVGVGARGSTPLAVLPGAVMGVVSILRLRS